MKPIAFLLFLALILAPAVDAAERGAARPAERQLSAATALHAKISEVRFDNAPLRECFEWLRDTLGTNLHVDWGALEAIGVDPDKTVTVNLRWVTVPRLLRLLLAESGQGELLTYYVSGNVLTITTKEKADEQLFTRVYPVEDLVLRPRKISRRSRMELGSSSSSGRGGGSGGGYSGGSSGGSSGGIFGDRDDSEEDDEEESDKARGQEVVDMVKQLTPAEIWEDAGGTSKILYFRGKLILTAPRSVHELIGGPIRD